MPNKTIYVRDEWFWRLLRECAAAEGKSVSAVLEREAYAYVVRCLNHRQPNH